MDIKRIIMHIFSLMLTYTHMTKKHIFSLMLVHFIYNDVIPVIYALLLLFTLSFRFLPSQPFSSHILLVIFVLLMVTCFYEI